MAWTCSGTVALNYNEGHLPISPAQIGNIPAQRELDQHQILSLSDLPTGPYSLSGRMIRALLTVERSVWRTYAQLGSQDPVNWLGDGARPLPAGFILAPDGTEWYWLLEAGWSGSPRLSKEYGILAMTRRLSSQGWQQESSRHLLIRWP